MRSSSTLGIPLTLITLTLLLLACGPSRGALRSGSAGKGQAKQAPALKLRSLTDTSGVTAIVETRDALWAGTRRGLIQWDLKTGKYQILGKKEGLPSESITALASDGNGGLWALTKGGLVHHASGVWRPAPAMSGGEFISGMVQTSDGALWVGGPEGLMRLRGERWERLLGDVAVTAITALGSEVWVGTSGRGVVRIAGKDASTYGPEQGFDLEVVRGLASSPFGLVAIGKDAGEQERIGLWDGKRFWSYRVEGPAGLVLEWVRHIGEETLIGSGGQVLMLAKTSFSSSSVAPPIKLVALPLRGPRQAPLRSAITSPLPETGKARPAAASGPRDREDPLRLELVRWRADLPDGTISIGPDGPALYVGTRFLGTIRVDRDRLTTYRIGDLAQEAVRLSVACLGASDCYLATGGPRAWRFDGRSFEPTSVDPEPNSRVLAVVNLPSTGVLAVHRSSKERILRLSQVADGRWTPVGVQEVQVPEGVPDITFAAFAPDGHLWIGLNYVDKTGDRVDYGAAEVSLDEGKVVYHRRAFGGRAPAQGLPIPTDVNSICFHGKEVWLGTRSGVAQVEGKNVRVFTENDDLDSEIIRDILEGPDGQVWIATARGIGKFDGRRWSFPKEGDPLRVRATALGRDRRGTAFIGTEQGLLIVGAAGVDRVDTGRGLPADRVLFLAVDPGERIWALTPQGLSIVER